MTEIQGLSPTLPIGTIYCIGRNYAAHARELHNEVPEKPVVFLKPVSSVIGNGGTIILPPQSKNVHHEVELLAAVGKEGKNIAAEKALQYIAGFGIGIDVTARDLQQQAKEKSCPWSVSKGFDTFAPVSHFLPSKKFDNSELFSLSLRVNGETRQRADTDLMIFTIPKLVAYLSTIFTLQPGDIIFTGTPAGVSNLNEGDLVEADLNNNQIVLQVDVK